MTPLSDLCDLDSDYVPLLSDASEEEEQEDSTTFQWHTTPSLTSNGNSKCNSSAYDPTIEDEGNSEDKVKSNVTVKTYNKGDKRK